MHVYIVNVVSLLNLVDYDLNVFTRSQIQFIYLYHICLDGIHDLLMAAQQVGLENVIYDK
jgi:hypothetical protein